VRLLLFEIHDGLRNAICQPLPKVYSRSDQRLDTLIVII
jgi:hypothetical protein